MRVDFAKLILSFSVAVVLSGIARADEPVGWFTNTDSYVYLGTPAKLQISNNTPFTVEGWVRLKTLVGGAQMIYSKISARGGAYTYMFGIRTSGTLMSAYTGQSGSPANTWRDVTVSPAMQTGRWYHVAYSFDGTNLTYYLDGVRKGAQAFSFGNTATHPSILGGYTANTDINGNKCEMRLWNYGRTGAEIRSLMNRRLKGGDSGMAGYWPMNEGSGTNILDQSGYGSHGGATNITWGTDALLSVALPSQADFINGLPFKMADFKTGSTRFTNSNEVDVASFPVPAGYDVYQITSSGESSAINPAGWVSTSTPPDMLTFDLPSATTNIAFYAWFTNSTQEASLRRSMGDITYTLTNPVPAVRATYSRMRVSGLPVVVYLAEIDTGTTGGSISGEPIPLQSRELQLVSGPDTNATPGSGTVTVSELGVYDIKLIAMNAAGNVATSAVCQVTVSAYDNGDFVWAGAANGFWSDPLNWNYKMVPPAGVNVRVTNGTPVLAASTENLNSFTQTGGTLTMTNWTTALVAKDVFLNGGSLTHPLQGQSATNYVGERWISDNRVWIVCSNFVLNTTLDVSKKGFRYNPGAGSLPGFGPGGGFGERGGGYGGKGGENPAGYGLVYGDVANPLWPGSSGGNRDNSGGRRAGSGGGLLVLEAAGHVVLNGTINANGESNYNAEYYGGGGGSGGGVNIRCATLAATNGTITAAGGNGGGFMGGTGGGGRIAIAVTDAAAQAALPVPKISFSVNRGLTGGYAGGNTYLGGYGTVFINHDSLFPLSGTNHGVFYGAGAVNVSCPSLTWTNSWIQLVSNETVSVAGNVMLNGSSFLGLGATAVGGDMVLTNLCTNSFFGIPTNGLSGFLTTRISVTGQLALASNCVVHVNSDTNTGGSLYFEVGRLHLAQGAVISASEAGFGAGKPKGSGPGAVSNILGGASYGGMGGRYPVHGGTTYGSAAHPSEPGSGGAVSSGTGRNGGGLVHIKATQNIALHGAIRANGGVAAANIGASSGGGVYLWADTFDPAFGVIQADGGAGTGTGGTAQGGGGGGRVARYYRVDGFAGTTTVAGGAGVYAGSNGTIVADYNATYITFTVEGSPARRGVPTPNYGANGVLLGSVITNQAPTFADEAGGIRYRCLGWTLTNDAGYSAFGTSTSIVYTVTTNSMLTWLWTNQYALAVSSGPNGSLVSDISGWYDLGETPILTPVANGGYAFSQWSGVYAPASLTLNPMPVVMDRPRTIRANFSLVGGEAKTWVGGTGNWMDAALWAPAGIPSTADNVTIGSGSVTLNEMSLSLAGLTVTNAASLTVASVPLAISGNLLITGATARVTMDRGDLDVGGNLTLLGGGDLYVNSAMTSLQRTEYGTRVSVTGSVSLANGSWIYPQSQTTNGGSVFFQAGELLVAVGGGFDADYRGYRGGLSMSESGGNATVGWGPGRGFNLGYGAGYGGCGGSAIAPYGQTNGVMEYPKGPGSGGGGNDGNPWRTGGSGGGLVWVEARQLIRLDGSLRANGQAGMGDYGSGGGSGGGIYLRCRKFEGGGSLSANAGNGWGGTSGTGGGGGRIAVWRVNHLFTGTVSVASGIPAGTPPAEQGTIYWGQVKGDGTIIFIR